MIKIAPSLLSADFSCLYEEIKKVERGADLLHIDVMDGHFVPNITFGPGVVACLRKRTSLPLDVHLMVDNPQEWIDPFARAGCDLITLHLEVSPHLERLITSVKGKGAKAGVALNPSTPLCELEYILPQLDLVLLMAVNPGFGAQDFLPQVLPKIENLAKIAKKGGFNFEIEVDGGINKNTAKKVAEAGATILVVGSAIFGASNPQKMLFRLKEEILSVNKDSTEKDGS